jgi:iron(III) transport system permease protein
MSKKFSIVVYAVTLLFFACFFLLPVTETLRGAFFDQDGRFTLAYITEVFRNPIYLEGLRNSFIVAVSVTILAMLIALPLAWIADRFLFPGKTLFSALILVPMILPPFVGAIGIKQILGQQGALNALLWHLGLQDPANPVDWLGGGQIWGVALMISLNLYPIIYLNAVAALANIDPAMEEAAENLGCTGFRKFVRITLPLIMPGLFAGGTIVFIWSFTELGVPLMFDFTRIASVQVFNGIKDIGGNPFPYALVAVMLASSVLLYAASKLTFGRSAHAMMAKATSQGGPRRVGMLAGLACTALFALVFFIAVLLHPEQPQIRRPRRAARSHPWRGHRLCRGADQSGRTPIPRCAGHAPAGRAGSRARFRLLGHDAGREALRFSQSRE